MELWQLKQMQSLPLEVKIEKTKLRIREWYEHFDGDVYVAFSGGLDSTVLRHLVNSIYPDVPSVFSNTGQEHPENIKFVRSLDNITWVKPKMTPKEVLEKHGYPVVSKKVARMLYDLQNPTPENAISRNLYLTGMKQDGTMTKHFKLPKKWHKLIEGPFKISHHCCDEVKKGPMKEYEQQTKRRAYIGELADEGKQRESSYLQTGCNNYGEKKSKPMGFWTHQDVLEYIVKYNVPYSAAYGDIIRVDGKLHTTKEQRTGCMYCLFGIHLEKQPNRMQRMALEYPKLYNYCLNDLGMKQVLDFINVPYEIVNGFYTEKNKDINGKTYEQLKIK